MSGDTSKSGRGGAEPPAPDPSGGATTPPGAGQGSDAGPDAGTVADYLRAHPHFLAERPELLAELVPADYQRADGAIDLQAYLVARQREEIAAVKAERDGLVELHRDNLATQSRIHEVVLKLIQAGSFEELVQLCTGEMAVLMDLDAAVLCVADPEDGIARTTTAGLRLIPAATIDEILGADSVALLDDRAGHPAVFGQAAGVVRSGAFVRVAAGDDVAGLLAFGTRTPGHFTPQQGTELLTFLARALEGAIANQLERGQ